MATPGFEFFGRVNRPDGVSERMEISPSNDVLKKYTAPDGTTFSSVQPPHMPHQQFVQEIRQTPSNMMFGFRQIFENRH